jgi:membrane associated rhomboid family serine protease
VLPLADTAKQKRTPVVTLFLVAVNFAVFAWQVWLFLAGGESATERFVMQHALVPQRLVGHWSEAALWQTLLTHMFLHGGIAHVLGNMWFLLIFGGNVEDRLGALRYLLFYIVAGLIAATAQFAIDPRAAVPMLGASGAISGVLGAYFILFPTAWVWTLVPWFVPIIPVPAVLFLVLWFVLQAFNGFGALIGAVTLGPDSANVAWMAHAGGFVAGVVLIVVARRRKWVRKR